MVIQASTRVRLNRGVEIWGGTDCPTVDDKGRGVIRNLSKGSRDGESGRCMAQDGVYDNQGKAGKEVQEVLSTYMSQMLGIKFQCGSWGQKSRFRGSFQPPFFNKIVIFLFLNDVHHR